MDSTQKQIACRSCDQNRRRLLKLSAAGGAALAAGAVPALAAGKGPTALPANRPQHAVDRFLASMNCSQAVLETYAPMVGLSTDNARRVSAAFAGGMGMGEECGAVTGAFMVIGLKYGKTVDRNSRADKKTFAAVARFMEEFKKRHQKTGCSELLGTDMGTPEGVKEAADKGLFTSACPGYVRSAAEILDDIMA
jgi:C_GCAxxG_C_C family probable redox protein